MKLLFSGVLSDPDSSAKLILELRNITLLRLDHLRLPREERIAVLAHVNWSIPKLNGKSLTEIVSGAIIAWWLHQCSIHLLQAALLQRAREVQNSTSGTSWLRYLQEWRRLERRPLSIRH